MRKRSTAFVLCLLGVAGAYWFAQAGELEPPGPPAPTMKTLDEVEARIPIHEADLPLTISQAGSYYLAEDVSLSTSTTAITIQASFVTIDLGGHRLAGSGGTGIDADADASRIEIRNGAVSGWTYGINLDGAPGSRVVGIRADDNSQYGVRVDADSLISDCVLTNNGFGVYNTATGGLFKDLVVSGNTSGGLALNGINNTIIGVVVSNNDGRGIYSGAGSHVIDSTAIGNDGQGISITGVGVIRNCLARLNTGAGIHIATSNARVEGNHATGNAIGIQIEVAGNVIIKNSSSGNSTNYDIVPGNDVGPIGPAATATSPWANIGP